MGVAIAILINSLHLKNNFNKMIKGGVIMATIKYRKLILLLSLLLASSMVFAGCFGDSDSAGGGPEKIGSDDSEMNEEDVDDIISKDYDNGIVFDEEMEGYEIKVEKTPPTEFIGSWEATSGNAHYLLGNMDIKIKADGTWEGNVVGDNLSGTWTEKDGGINIKCNDSSINFGGQMLFTPDGTLIYSYYPFEDSEEPNNIVLTKK